MKYSKFLRDTATTLKAFKPAKVNPAVVELVAIGPYLVDLDYPDRKAKAILTLLKADAENYVDMGLVPGESLESYLSTGLDFGVAATPALIKRNALLMIVAINDQYHDRKNDKANNKANVFDHCQTDAEADQYYKSLISSYSATADSIVAPEVDSILTTKKAVAMGGW